MPAPTPREAGAAARAAIVALCVATVASKGDSWTASASRVLASTELVSLVTKDLLRRNVSACDDSFCRDRRETDKPSSDSIIASGCYCDETCEDFGDCCLNDSDVEDRSREDISCMRLRSDLGVYVVSRCPDDWPRDETRQRCESQGFLANDPLLGLPVTSPHTKMTYRNSACAQCHSDTKDVVLWTVRVQCHGLERDHESDAVWSSLKRNAFGDWGVTLNEDDGEKFYHCSVSPDMPEGLQDVVRSCLPVVSDCAEGGADPEAAALCRMYTALVRDAGRSGGAAESVEHVYRNPHCALCHGIAPENITCRWNPDGVEKGTQSTGVSFVFSVPRTEHVHEGNSTDSCPGSQLWDPFLHKCRNLFCDTGHSLLGDTCILNSSRTSRVIPATNNTTRHLPIRSCNKFVVFPDEFIQEDNGSVYVVSYDRHYDPWEYEHVGDNIAVCYEMVAFKKLSDTLAIITRVSASASIVCLCAHLAVFSMVPKLRNLPGRNLASLCVTLLVVYACFLAETLPEVGSSSCRSFAVVIYTAFNASLLWTNVMAFDVFTTLRRSATELRVSVGGRPRRYLLYTLYVATLTGALTLAVITMDTLDGVADPYRPGFGETTCWFSRPKAMMLFFGLPLVVVMVANVALFCGSAFIIRRTAKASANATSSKTNLRLYTRLALMTGMSWVVGLVAGWLHLRLLWSLFVVLDTLKGVFIFVSFTLPQRVRRDIMKELSRYSSRGKSSKEEAVIRGSEKGPRTLRKTAVVDGDGRAAEGVGDKKNIDDSGSRGHNKESGTKGNMNDLKTTGDKKEGDGGERGDGDTRERGAPIGHHSGVESGDEKRDRERRREWSQRSLNRGEEA